MSSGREIPNLENYSIVEEIGHGGMGTVYRAKDRVNRDMAIKVIHPELANDGSLRERFEREGETLATLGEHDNIVFLYGLFEENIVTWTGWPNAPEAGSLIGTDVLICLGGPGRLIATESGLTDRA